jgi:integrase/recombinase XerD
MGLSGMPSLPRIRNRQVSGSSPLVGSILFIKNDRHPIVNDALFIRARAPFGPFASHCAISVIVAQAMRRAGVRCPSRGAAHVLRHSVASSMLRQGASLQEIAGVLRHRSIATTEIYAKVDVVALREIAQSWPEVTAC